MILPALFLINGSLVLAHGAIAPQDKTLHPPTQIGLLESRTGHQHGTNLGDTPAEGGLTRNQIVNLIHKDQDQENFRSGVKLILLSGLIIIVGVLFYPRKQTTTTVPAGDNLELQEPAAISSPSKSV